MARPRKSTLVHVGGMYDPGLATAFGNLANSKGVSMREALRRVMTQAVLDKQIPGIIDLNITAHERESWAAPTLDYAGETQKAPTKPVEAEK